MNHAIDVALQANEQTEFGDVFDFTFNLATLWVLFCEHFPWIALCLFQTQGNATLYAINFQNHHVNFLRSGYDFAWVYVFLSPRHLRNVHQTFNTSFKLNKCAVIGDICYTAFMLRCQLVFDTDDIPGVVHQLFHAQADAMGFFVDFDNLNFDGFTNGQDL